MATTEQLVQLLQEQLQLQREQMLAQEKHYQEQMTTLVNSLTTSTGGSHGGTAGTVVQSGQVTFVQFDPASELWTDYWKRFQTFVVANSIPERKQAHVFLTNQSLVTYKLLSNLAAQQSSPKDVNDLTLNEIYNFMLDQYHPKQFIVRERFKFWSKMDRKLGESIQELVARIRQDAVTCDFSSISDLQDEAMRTRFICSINNKAVLKAIFKVKDSDLTFNKAIEIAIETEDAAKVAKETVHGPKSTPVYKVDEQFGKGKGKNGKDVRCFCCNRRGHFAGDCRYKDSSCNYCKEKGHLVAACPKRKKAKTSLGPHKPVKTIKAVHTAATVCKVEKVPVLQQTISINGQVIDFEVDTGAGENFMGRTVWEQLGEPELVGSSQQFQSASEHPLPVMGSVTVQAQKPEGEGVFGRSQELEFNVTEQPQLNLLGRSAIQELGISVDSLLHQKGGRKVHKVFDDLEPDLKLKKDCQQLCQEFPDLFKPELGCLKDFELEVKFKEESSPVFCKPRPVPFAIQEDLYQSIQAGIKRGVWVRTQFNDYGTPVVPVRKTVLPGENKPRVRVCGDYSVTINPKLEPHRYPMPLPEDLMRKLGGGYGFTKIDLADAYNQIPLGPISQKRLALSTNQGVLLQMRLPFGIISAPGYFQEIMDKLTADLPGVAAYLDDILVSGATAQEHLDNLKRLLQRLSDQGLRCRLEKCVFAQLSI